MDTTIKLKTENLEPLMEDIRELDRLLVEVKKVRDRISNTVLKFDVKAGE